MGDIPLKGSVGPWPLPLSFLRGHEVSILLQHTFPLIAIWHLHHRFKAKSSLDLGLEAPKL
jgi:hypothetical protein